MELGTKFAVAAAGTSSGAGGIYGGVEYMRQKEAASKSTDSAPSTTQRSQESTDPATSQTNPQPANSNSESGVTPGVGG